MLTYQEMCDRRAEVTRPRCDVQTAHPLDGPPVDLADERGAKAAPHPLNRELLQARAQLGAGSRGSARKDSGEQ